jgi:predicted phage terminase large subunit-like protein
VPLRMRAASNPGGPGHQWVKSRLVDPRSREPEAVFVPAKIQDNPHMNYDEYMRSLMHLSPIDRERLIRGDWDVLEEGGLFDRNAFKVVDRPPAIPVAKSVRYWDLAATEETEANRDPDWTVGVRLDWLRNGEFCVSNIVRGRWAPHTVEENVRGVANADGRLVPVVLEQEPGASGKTVVSYWQRHVLPGWTVKAGLTRIKGRPASKVARAAPWSAAVGNGHVYVVRGPHLLAFLEEHGMFPHEGVHDDTVDASSGAHTHLTGGFVPSGGGPLCVRLAC